MDTKNEPIIYKGRGSEEIYDDLMDFINYVFGFNGNGEDFKKLLPKLYKPEYKPCESNYIVTEDGKLRAAIGAFDDALTVCGKTLKVRGIGNVAVHPYHRSKGYMIDSMNLAIEDMKKDGVDLSILGGQRQRYGYFGYDSVGVGANVDITPTNLRHCFANVPFRKLEIRTVEDSDTELIDEIYALFCTRPIRSLRSRERFPDICRSWSSPLRAVLDGDKLIGYYVADMKELTLYDMADFNDVVRNHVRNFGSVGLMVPSWDKKLLEAAMRICESTRFCTFFQFNIFNFGNVAEACMLLKAGTEGMTDGEITLEIHGVNKTEKLRLAVTGGVPSVSEYDGECQFVLEHKEAMQFLFGLYSPFTAALKPELRTWFPLPLWMESADDV